MTRIINLFWFFRRLYYRNRSFWRRVYYGVTDALMIIGGSAVLFGIWYFLFEVAPW